ncbi:PriCT-2 domain-containing protein [Mesorhizobium kowhaii]|uniref:Primase C-terminal 2 domain-containing protein n=1 Tax=Mesorhizobium kowhaii TaxID=1300272 RepID=A0A2W7CK14_9HYPH|nr:PriCT-2 domain-containing protein [Mesorhizobium kowhaii]PZV36893.1 hypothetical protein B5V02_19520 [Mesorhizobium kowhaii]
MNRADRHRWMLYCLSDGNKIPYGINGHWGLTDGQPGTLAQVDALWAKLPCAFAGRGYVPHIDDDLGCLDFDDLTHPFWPQLLTFTHCELSPSREGGHAIVTINREAKERLKGIRHIYGIELFSDSGFFTVTGLALNTLPIADASDHLCGLADRLNLHPANGQAITPSCLLPIDYLRGALRLIDPNCSWHDWFQALAAVHCATGGSYAGKTLLHEWGRTGSKYNDASRDKIDRDWDKLDDTKRKYDPDKTLQILQRANTSGRVTLDWSKS